MSNKTINLIFKFSDGSEQNAEFTTVGDVKPHNDLNLSGIYINRKPIKGIVNYHPALSDSISITPDADVWDDILLSPFSELITKNSDTGKYQFYIPNTELEGLADYDLTSDDDKFTFKWHVAVSAEFSWIDAATTSRKKVHILYPVSSYNINIGRQPSDQAVELDGVVEEDISFLGELLQIGFVTKDISLGDLDNVQLDGTLSPEGMYYNLVFSTELTIGN